MGYGDGNNEQKIDVEAGGNVTQGETFKWKNGKGKGVLASGFTNILDSASYDVPPQANGKPGEKTATVLQTAPVGAHVYTTSDQITAGTPTLTVTRSPMK
jgi:hypothetical protein